MKPDSTTIAAARIRGAIYLTGGAICLGLVFGQGGLLIAALLLFLIAYIELDRARVAKAEPSPAGERMHDAEQTPERRELAGSGQQENPAQW